MKATVGVLSVAFLVSLAIYWLGYATKKAGPVKIPDSHFFSQRAYPYDKIDLSALNAARQSFTNYSRSSTLTGASWIQRGPYKIQGRVTAIAVDPRDENLAFVAAAEGGVFRTLDGGESWEALFDFMPSLSIGAIALDSNNPDVVYVGTGEVNPGGGSVAYGGTGLYRSDDQGDTWQCIGLENSGSIGRIVVNPNNPDIIHVAVMGHLWAGGTERGVYRTSDGGDTWQRVLFVNETTGCVDIVQRPDNPDVLWAAMWQRIRTPGAFDYGGAGCGVYRSDDGGMNWSLVENGLPASSNQLGRIGLAVSQSNPDVMCAIYADRIGFFDGLYRTEDGGVNWFRTNDGALNNVYSSFGWWFGNVRIQPDDEDVIFVIGLNVFRSGDGGGSYTQVGANMHVDHHGFAFASGEEPKMYAGNDGGVYTSDDGIGFTKTTGDLPITQGYRIAVSELNTNAIWVGTQDNGTNRDLDGDGVFQRFLGGDGFQPVPHMTDENRSWAQFQYGNVFYFSGSNSANATAGLSGRVNWNAPHTQDPNDPERRYFGTHRVYRNVGDTSWTSISPDLTGGVNQGNQGQVNGTLTTISVSPADSSVIWTGSDDGKVFVTNNHGGSWQDVSNNSVLPERWVTSIYCHPENAHFVLVTFSGFRWNENISHVYRTVDGGISWTPIDNNLPDVPVNDVFIDPENLSHYFVATDAGVYRSTNAGKNWELFGFGLPNVVVTDLAFLNSTRELYACTYGRSIFSIAVDSEILLGDVNRDGDVNLLDVAPFVTVLVNASFQAEADMDKNGIVDLLDVNPFVDALVND